MSRKALVVIIWQPQAGAAEKQVLTLRLTPGRGGFWQSVTGKVEEGESFAEGALREAEEETGLRFERQPQYLGLEQSFPNRHDGKMVRERSFFLPLFGGSAPPTPSLDGKEHDAYEWLPPAEAAARVKFPANREAIERASSGAAPLLLTKRGAFYQDGEEVTHTRTVELLHRSLVRDPSGRYAVRVGEDELDVVVEGSPRFVLSVDRGSGRIKLLGGLEETLDPSTLRIERDHSFSCALTGGWRATLLPSAYYELAKDVREGSETGQHRLHFLGRDYELRVADEGEGMDR